MWYRKDIGSEGLAVAGTAGELPILPVFPRDQELGNLLFPSPFSTTSYITIKIAGEAFMARSISPGHILWLLPEPTYLGQVIDPPPAACYDHPVLILSTNPPTCQASVLIVHLTQPASI